MYAQIEKELLAFVFRYTHFHQYLYGKYVEVESDHRSHEIIFKKPLCDIPLRLQHMRLHLQEYDIEIKYKPGEDLLLADTLSRNCIYPDDNILEKETEAQLGMIISNLPVKNRKI